MALKVLVEKLNIQGVDRSQLTNKQKSCASFNAVCKEFDKVNYVCVCACALVCMYVYVQVCICIRAQTNLDF